jgi:hypothetical protein
MKVEDSLLLHEIAGGRALAEALAQSIAERLAPAIAARRKASLALSGGPGGFARCARAAHRVLVSINFKSLRRSRPWFMRRSPR